MEKDITFLAKRTLNMILMMINTFNRKCICKRLTWNWNIKTSKNLFINQTGCFVFCLIKQRDNVKSQREKPVILLINKLFI